MKKKFLLLLLSVLFISACATENAKTQESALDVVPTEYAGKTNPLGSDAAVAGAEVYKSYCASCHGEYGRGDGVAGASLQPPPKNLVAFQSQVADDYLFWRISTGKPGTSMVAWEGVLTDEQIWQVVSFIRTMR